MQRIWYVQCFARRLVYFSNICVIIISIDSLMLAISICKLQKNSTDQILPILNCFFEVELMENEIKYDQFRIECDTLETFHSALYSGPYSPQKQGITAYNMYSALYEVHVRLHHLPLSRVKVQFGATLCTCSHSSGIIFKEETKINSI